MVEIQIIERRRRIVTAVQLVGTAVILICQIICGNMQLTPEWFQWFFWPSLVVVWGFGWAGMAIWLVAKREKLNKQIRELLTPA
jgi:protein-S-isoprenylcysteine O-methyltransferase Ste14